MGRGNGGFFSFLRCPFLFLDVESCSSCGVHPFILVLASSFSWSWCLLVIASLLPGWFGDGRVFVFWALRLVMTALTRLFVSGEPCSMWFEDV